MNILNLFQPQAHVTAKLIIDAKEYPISYFYIGFSQGVDHKGQPQQDVRGGQLKIVIKESVDKSIYDWARQSSALKSGIVKFGDDFEQTKLRVTFEKAFCISLVRDIDAYKGTTTVLVIAPEKIKLNENEHNNYWRS